MARETARDEMNAAGQVINCPYCKKEIRLSEVLTGEIRAHLETENKLKLQKEFEKLETDARKRATEESGKSIEALKKELLISRKKEQDLAEQIAAKDKAVLEAQAQEIEFRRKQRELEAREKSLQLQIERAIDDKRKEIQKEANKEIQDRVGEKEILIEGLKKKVIEMEQKITQGSQQVQGETQELELEETLKSAFPRDIILPVPKGVKGADILHEVLSNSGRQCGIIYWESKRTKQWSKEWIDKLKSDQREAKADVAAIVSKTMPEGAGHILNIDGIWVCDYQSAMGLALVLRESLVQLDRFRGALAGKNEKMDLVYNYFSGNDFKQRIESLVESYLSMKRDLDGEKLAMEKIWAKRDKQIQVLAKGLAGVYGDLQGLLGPSLPEIKNLELPQGDPK